jgi:hypothetical protein
MNCKVLGRKFSTPYRSSITSSALIPSTDQLDAGIVVRVVCWIRWAVGLGLVCPLDCTRLVPDRMHTGKRKRNEIKTQQTGLKKKERNEGKQKK